MLPQAAVAYYVDGFAAQFLTMMMRGSQDARRGLPGGVTERMWADPDGPALVFWRLVLLRMADPEGVTWHNARIIRRGAPGLASWILLDLIEGIRTLYVLRRLRLPDAWYRRLRYYVRDVLIEMFPANEMVEMVDDEQVDGMQLPQAVARDLTAEDAAWLRAVLRAAVARIGVVGGEGREAEEAEQWVAAAVAALASALDARGAAAAAVQAAMYMADDPEFLSFKPQVSVVLGSVNWRAQRCVLGMRSGLVLLIHGVCLISPPFLRALPLLAAPRGDAGIRRRGDGCAGREGRGAGRARCAFPGMRCPGGLGRRAHGGAGGLTARGGRRGRACRGGCCGGG